MSQVQWKIAGDYFEACNCDTPCPCIFGTNPSEGFCDVAVAWHITSGNYGTVSLDGLNAAMVVHTPGNMGAGGWTTGFLVDDTATPEQRAAMEAILSGMAGGRFQRTAAITAEFLGVKFVPMTFTLEGKTRSLIIPDILDAKVEAVIGRFPDELVQISNAPGSLVPGFPQVVARAEENRLDMPGLKWDSKGKTGYYARFEYSS